MTRTRAPLSTTNYDRLVEEAAGRGSRTWTDDLDVAAWLRQPPPARDVFHLHGVYTHPASVVLGHTSHQSLLLHGQARFVQRVVAATSSLVLVGCGRAVEAPNLGALMDWVARDPVARTRRHYRLCLAAEEAEVARPYADGSRVAPVPYGDAHGDPAGFVARRLGHPEAVLDGTAHALAQAYQGMTDEAYPGAERWQGKDRIFDLMRTYAATHDPDLDASEALPGDGFKALAVAAMTNRPAADHDARLTRMCAGALPVNVAYRVCDYVRARCATPGVGPEAVTASRALLDRVVAMHPASDDLRRYADDARPPAV